MAHALACGFVIPPPTWFRRTVLHAPAHGFVIPPSTWFCRTILHALAHSFVTPTPSWFCRTVRRAPACGFVTPVPPWFRRTILHALARGFVTPAPNGSVEPFVISHPRFFYTSTSTYPHHHDMLHFYFSSTPHDCSCTIFPLPGHGFLSHIERDVRTPRLPMF
jgi:hypothetical protein